MWLIRLSSTSAHRTADRCSVSECFKNMPALTDRQGTNQEATGEKSV